MHRSSTQQTFIQASPDRVWELVGDPNRHPEWWPEMLEVECADLKEGCRYRGVVKGPFGRLAQRLDHRGRHVRRPAGGGSRVAGLA